MLLLALKNLLQSSILLYSFHSVFPVFSISPAQPDNDSTYVTKLDTRKKQVSTLLTNLELLGKVQNKNRLNEINKLLDNLKLNDSTTSESLATEIFKNSKTADDQKTAQNILELVYSLCKDQRDRVEVLHHIIKEARNESPEKPDLLSTLNTELKKYFVGNDNSGGSAGGQQSDKGEGENNDKERNRRFEEIKTKLPQNQFTAHLSIEDFMKHYQEIVENPRIAHEDKSLYIFRDFETAATLAANAVGPQQDLQTLLKEAKKKLLTQLYEGTQEKINKNPATLKDKVRQGFEEEIYKFEQKINDLAQITTKQALDKEKLDITKEVDALSKKITDAITESKTELDKAKQAAQGELNRQLNEVQGLIDQLAVLNDQHELVTERDQTRDKLQSDIDNLPSDNLDKQKDDIKTRIDTLSQQVRDAIDEAQQALQDQLDNDKDAWIKQLKGVSQNLQQLPLGDKKTEFEKSITDLETKITGLDLPQITTQQTLDKEKQDIEQDINALKSNIQAAIDAANKDLKTQLDQAKVALTARLGEVQGLIDQLAELNDQHPLVTERYQTPTGLQDRINGLDQITTQPALDKEKQDIEQDINALKSNIQAAIDAAQKVLKTQLDQAKVAWRTHLQDLTNQLKDPSPLNKEEKEGFVKQIEELKKEIAKLGNPPLTNQMALKEQKQTIETQINTLLTEITTAIDKAKNELAQAKQDAIRDLNGKLEDLREKLVQLPLNKEEKEGFEKKIEDLKKDIAKLGNPPLPTQEAPKHQNSKINQSTQEDDDKLNEISNGMELNQQKSMYTYRIDLLLKEIALEFRTKITNDLNQDLPIIKSQVEEFKKLATAINSNDFKNKIPTFQTQIQNLKPYGSPEYFKNKYTENSIDSIHRIYIDLNNLSQQVSDAIAKAQQVLQALLKAAQGALNSQIDEVQRLITELKKLNSKHPLVTNWDQTHTGLRQAIEDLNSVNLDQQKGDIETQIDDLRAIIATAIETAQQALEDAKQAAIRDLNGKLEDLREKLNKLPLNDEEKEGFEKQIKEFDKHFNELNDIKNQDDLKKKKEQIDKYIDTLLNLSESDLKDLANHYVRLNQIENTIKEYEFDIINRNDAFNRIIDETKILLKVSPNKKTEIQLYLKQLETGLSLLKNQDYQIKTNPKIKKTLEIIQDLFQKISIENFEDTFKDIQRKLNNLKTVDEAFKKEKKEEEEKVTQCQNLKAECDKIISSINLLENNLGYKKLTPRETVTNSDNLSTTIAFYKEHLTTSENRFNKLVEEFKQTQLDKLEIEFQKLTDSHYKKLIEELIYNNLQADIKNLESTDPNFDQKSQSILESVESCLANISEFQKLEKIKAELYAKLNALRGRDEAIKDSIDRIKTSLNEDTIQNYDGEIEEVLSSIFTHLGVIESNIETLEDELAKQSTESSRAHTTMHTPFSKRRVSNEKLSQQAIDSLQKQINSNKPLIDQLETLTYKAIQGAIQRSQAPILSYKAAGNSNPLVVELSKQLNTFEQYANTLFKGYLNEINYSIEQLKTLQTKNPESSISLNITTYTESFNWFKNNNSLLNRTQKNDFETRLKSLFNQIVFHHFSRLEKIETLSIELFEKGEPTQQGFEITKPSSPQGSATGRNTVHEGELHSINQYSTVPVTLTKTYSEENKNQFIPELYSILSPVEKNQFPIIEVGNKSFKITTHESGFKLFNSDTEIGTFSDLNQLVNYIYSTQPRNQSITLCLKSPSNELKKEFREHHYVNKNGALKFGVKNPALTTLPPKTFLDLIEKGDLRISTFFGLVQSTIPSTPRSNSTDADKPALSPHELFPQQPSK